MASQEDTCWQCDARLGATAAEDLVGDRIARELRTDADRWTDEGGSLVPEYPAPATAIG